MLEKFLSGFVTCIPFFYRNNNEAKYYPDDIFVNDWKIIGKIIVDWTRSK
ncbi:MAG: hypothetical protein LBB09_00775 [Rickettsiales bacterium]|jgi:hypothetical protein|nr:hypothetical protein [Rickettsiales bacterium]